MGKLILLCLLLLESLSLAVSSTPHKSAYLRFEGSIHHPKINGKNDHIAFTDAKGFGLKIINLKTQEIHELSSHKVAQSFFWAPNGFRLFYREMYQRSGKVVSEIKAYDLPLRKSFNIETLDGPSGDLSFDPRDLRFYLYHARGIVRHQIQYPGERLAKWQIAMKNKDGYWLCTENSILWVSNNGLSMRRINETDAKISSFDISPDGKSIVWADQEEGVYLSEDGQKAKVLSEGLDPKWHPNGKWIIYSHARRLADKIVDHDLRIMDRTGHGRFLTKTMSTNERFPVWSQRSSSIIYTHWASTDLYELSFKP